MWGQVQNHERISIDNKPPRVIFYNATPIIDAYLPAWILVTLAKVCSMLSLPNGLLCSSVKVYSFIPAPQGLDTQVILSIIFVIVFLCGSLYVEGLYVEGLYVEGSFLDALLAFTGTSPAAEYCKLKQYATVNWLPEKAYLLSTGATLSCQNQSDCI